MDFENIVEIFNSELQQPVKIAFKLSHRSLYPGPIERQSVLLAQSIFHESTAHALHFYGTQNHRKDFLETEKFINIILCWWKHVNVKSKFTGRQHLDDARTAVDHNNVVEKTRFEF